MGNGMDAGIDPNNPTAASSVSAPQGNPKILQLLMALKQLRSRNAQGGQPQQGQPQGQPSPGGTPPVPGMPMPSGPTGGGGGGGSPSTAGMMSTIDPVGTQTYKGFQGLAGLLQQWTSRKSEKEHVEAANIAMKLRKAMDDNDVAMVHEILNDKNATKVLNKVYKGWLTKAEESNKPGKPPDPAVSGFEKGVTDYEKGKAQQPPQGRQEGGYLLPQAGPAQQLQGIKTGAELSAAQADPKRTLDSQLSSDEMRKAERAKAGLDSTPATEAKMQEIAAKLQSAQLGVQKAQLELQTQQAKLQESGERSSAAAKKADFDLQKAQIQLDIEKTRLMLLREKPAAGSKNQPPVATVGKLKALEDAEAYAQNVLKTRAKGGFTTQDVQTLTGLLRQAGATSTAQSLPGWYGRNMPTWLGGKGEEDVAGMLETIQQLKSGIQDTIDARYPGWQGGGTKPKTGEEPPADGGEEDDSDIVVSPEEVAQ